MHNVKRQLYRSPATLDRLILDMLEEAERPLTAYEPSERSRRSDSVITPTQIYRALNGFPAFTSVSQQPLQAERVRQLKLKVEAIEVLTTAGVARNEFLSRQGMQPQFGTLGRFGRRGNAGFVANENPRGWCSVVGHSPITSAERQEQQAERAATYGNRTR